MTLTDRVPFCVVKANCPGPSVITSYGKKDDIWTCKQCGGTLTCDSDKVPEKDKRSEHEYGSRM